MTLTPSHRCYLHPDECARDRLLLFYSRSSVSRSKLPAGREETKVGPRTCGERSADREEPCVYIWSQINLVDKKEGRTTFTLIWLPHTVKSGRLKTTTSANGFQNKTHFLDVFLTSGFWRQSREHIFFCPVG